MTTEENFRAAMQAAGLEFSGRILADGRLHRFKASGDRERNSWYVLHSDPPATGAFGCWKRGFKETWQERTGQMSDIERKEVRRRCQEAERERERTENERHSKARKIAEWILSRSSAVGSHPYLTAKGVTSFGHVRQYRGALVLPLRDANDQLHSLQFISTEGTKRFLTGGRIEGCFFTLSDKPNGALVVCEGYATGASIHAATGLAVVCAMNCGNLLAVVQTLRDKWPKREIVIAADNDQFTDGNPGMTKATAAAKAIRAKLATPQFADISTRPTDYNDLGKLKGQDVLRHQVESATLQRESDQEALQRLAALPMLEYERQRERAAQVLGCRTSVLDKQVDAKRKELDHVNATLQGSSLDFADAEAWSEPVNGSELLDELAEAFARYIVLPAGAADVLALWCAHTYAFDAFVCSPRLNITSPEKQCGKTTLRDVLAELVPRPLATENMSVAVLFRVIEAHKPTVLADECDAWLRDNEELRGMLNSGHRRGGKVYRCEGEGNEVRGFNVFAPSVLCGIGSLPGTLHDRSIVIRLERAKPQELCERFDSRHTQHEQELCRKLVRFCNDNRERFESCDPMLPPEAFNRISDNWRPLFAVAEIAGGDWPQRANAAFAKLLSKQDVDAQGIGTMLLADIQQALTEVNGERIFSKTLVEYLCAMSDRPWPEAHRGKPITETWLARRLRSFDISPRLLRIDGGRARGYELVQFADAFDRYLPRDSLSMRDTVTMPENIGDYQYPKRDNESTRHGLKTHEPTENIGLSRCHASILPDLHNTQSLTEVFEL